MKMTPHPPSHLEHPLPRERAGFLNFCPLPWREGPSREAREPREGSFHPARRQPQTMKSLLSPPWAPLGERVSRPVGTGEGGARQNRKILEATPRATRWLGQNWATTRVAPT